MGKSRGGKYHKKAPRRGPGEEEESSEEEEFIQRGVGEDGCPVPQWGGAIWLKGDTVILK